MLNFLLNFFQAYGQALWSVPFLLLLCLAGAVCYLIYRDPVQAGSFLFYQLFRALPAGLLGSLLLVLAGIRAEAVTSLWLLPVSGILALWQPRFLCLAYSGSLLCLSRLVWGIPQVEPPQLMALVALLHVAEGLLVLTEKSKGLRPRLIPVACSGSRGKTLGEKRLPGYQKRRDLQRFWPLPLVLLTAARLPYAGLDGLWAAAAEMPGWWPLLGRELLEEAADPKGLGGDLFLSLVPLTTALGFCQSFASGREASGLRRAGAALLLYSALLFALAWLADRFADVRLLQWGPPLFAIAGHELICRSHAAFGTDKK